MHHPPSAPTTSPNAASAHVLLTVSGTIPSTIEDEIRRGLRPKTDYQELARALPADLIDVTKARQITGWLGRVIERLGGVNMLLAWACYCLRQRYKVLFTDGEQVGIFLALLLKFLHSGPRPRHLMFTHILSVRKKMIFFDYLKLQSHIDTFFVYASYQKQFIHNRWRLPDKQVVLTPFMVDTQFFSPELAAPRPQPRPMICAVGREARDYDTLLAAVVDLPLDVMIVAGSLWSRRADSTQGRQLPANVTVGQYSYVELRQIYADAALVVLPLRPNNFQAGITSLLEAMAMGKAVICSRTTGMADLLVEGESGLYVPPEDAAALRAAILHLLDDPSRRAKLGQTGYRRVFQAGLSLKHYVERLRPYVATIRNEERRDDKTSLTYR